MNEEPTRPPKPVYPFTTGQFIGLVAADTIGFALWAFPYPSAANAFGGFILVWSNFIGMSAEERSKPLRWSDLWIGLLMLAVILLLVAATKLFPEHLFAFFHHPVFIGLLWAFAVWAAYRRWRRSNRPAPPSL